MNLTVPSDPESDQEHIHLDLKDRRVCSYPIATLWFTTHALTSVTIQEHNWSGIINECASTPAVFRSELCQIRSESARIFLLIPM